MKSCFGNNINISLFGESHSKGIGVVINGLAPGLKLDLDFINHQLEKRKPKGKISTSRQEPDEIDFLSGYFNGFTTGTPLCMVIYNKSQKSNDYEKTKNLMRPSHADFTAQEKYMGFQDYRGGGHFSGRITAPLVATGAICMQILSKKGVSIATHIKDCNGILDSDFSENEIELAKQFSDLNSKYFPTIDNKIGNKMQENIEQVQLQGDSVGGILETLINNLPAGVGEPFFNSIESTLSQLIFSVPAVKGIEFGLGFAFSQKTGSQANDPFYFDEKTKSVKTKTNNNGGINGGISNGMPIVIKTVVKPTPSIYKPQETVDISTMKNSNLQIVGRHDPAIIHRARVVIDSVIAIGLVDLFCERNGYMWQIDR